MSRTKNERVQFHEERKPKKPWDDWRTFALLVPILASALGFTIYSIFTYAFDDIGVLPKETQSIMILVAAIGTSIGAEFGTPITMSEVFRRVRRKEANWLDKSALYASLVATLIALSVALSARIVQKNEFAIWITMWGPVIVGVVVGLDAYGGYIELSGIFADYDDEMKHWLDVKEELLANGELSTVDRFLQLSEKVDSLTDELDRRSWPVLTKAEFMDHVANMNGDKPDFEQHGVNAILPIAEKLKRNPPQERTMTRWIKELS